MQRAASEGLLEVLELLKRLKTHNIGGERGVRGPKLMTLLDFGLFSCQIKISRVLLTLGLPLKVRSSSLSLKRAQKLRGHHGPPEKLFFIAFPL